MSILSILMTESDRASKFLFVQCLNFQLIGPWFTELTVVKPISVLRLNPTEFNTNAHYTLLSQTQQIMYYLCILECTTSEFLRFTSYINLLTNGGPQILTTKGSRPVGLGGLVTVTHLQGVWQHGNFPAQPRADSKFFTWIHTICILTSSTASEKCFEKVHLGISFGNLDVNTKSRVIVLFWQNRTRTYFFPVKI